MRDTKSQIWMAASLFSLKFYTVFAAGLLFCWYLKLPDQPLGYLEHSGAMTIGYLGHDVAGSAFAWGDFGYMTTVAVYAYFVCGSILVLGGLIQKKNGLRRDAYLTIIFGMAALVIACNLIPICYPEPDIQFQTIIKSID